MLITLLILILISNAVTINQEKSILYSRVVIQGLAFVAFIGYNNLYIKPLEKGIGLYGGLFNVTTFTQSFNIFIVLLGAIIAILTAFYPRKAYSLTVGGGIIQSNLNSQKSINNENNTMLKQIGVGLEKLLLNKKSGQFMIIEYGLIMVFVLCGAVFLMSTGDLISMFLSIELQSYGLYILSTLYRDSESATGSGLTYFLLGGLSSCFILLGSALLYVNSGTTNLDNIYMITSINELSSLTYNKAIYWYQPYYLHFSLIILAVGFLFKISAAPFHFWSPDVYDGIPTIVTTFVAIIAKISIFVIILELVLYTEYNYNDVYSYFANTGLHNLNTLNIDISVEEERKEFRWKNILIFSSFLSLVVGSVLGLTQYRIKRLFAYSTISHVGFILLALCINKIESVQGYIFYILQYSISNLNAFIILVTIGFTLYLYIYNPNGQKDPTLPLGTGELKLVDEKNSPIQFISQLKGYFYINSFLSISLAITLFSFVGIPPLIGFFAKQMVLSAAIEEGFIFMSLVGIVTSVIGAVYYLNLIKLIFFYKSDYYPIELNNGSFIAIDGKAMEQKEEDKIIFSINSGLSVTISVLTMLIILFIYIPGEWFNIISILSLTLFNI